MQSSIIIVLVTLLVACEAYRVSKPIMRVRMLKMSDSEEPFQPEETAEGQLKFDMNRRVRLGRSKDQDGKSNIWSIEPTMEVDESEEGNQSKKNLILGVVLIGGAIACLPLFSAFSSLIPDPADF